MKVLPYLCAAVLLMIGVAAAQETPDLTQTPAPTSREVFVSNCEMAGYADGLTKPTPACSCAADFLASKMTPDEFAVSAEMMSLYDADDETMEAWIISKLQNDEYSIELILAAASKMETEADGLDLACGYLEE